MSGIFWRKNGVLMTDYVSRVDNHKLLLTSDDDLCAPSGGVIAQQITNKDGGTGVPTWNLRAYKFIDLQRQPFQRWVLREVGSPHWHDPERACTGETYGQGDIDQVTGELIWLPDEFVSPFSYDGYMQLIGLSFDCTTHTYKGPCYT